jgi:hypothetical protein
MNANSLNVTDKGADNKHKLMIGQPSSRSQKSLRTARFIPAHIFGNPIRYSPAGDQMGVQFTFPKACECNPHPRIEILVNS